MWRVQLFSVAQPSSGRRPTGGCHPVTAPCGSLFQPTYLHLSSPARHPASHFHVVATNVINYDRAVEKMSNLELPVSPGAASPTRSSKRHQIKRSLSELASPTRSTRGQHKGNEINQDDKRLHPFHSNTSGRHSLDVPGLDGSTSIRSPVESRRASVLILAPENDARTRSREVQDRELHQVQAQMTESFE